MTIAQFRDEGCTRPGQILAKAVTVGCKGVSPILDGAIHSKYEDFKRERPKIEELPVVSSTGPACLVGSDEGRTTDGMKKESPGRSSAPSRPNVGSAKVIIMEDDRWEAALRSK